MSTTTQLSLGARHPALRREIIRAGRELPSREQTHDVMAHESCGYLRVETTTDAQWRYIGQLNGVMFQ